MMPIKVKVSSPTRKEGRSGESKKLFDPGGVRSRRVGRAGVQEGGAMDCARIERTRKDLYSSKRSLASGRGGGGNGNCRARVNVFPYNMEAAA